MPNVPGTSVAPETHGPMYLLDTDTPEQPHQEVARHRFGYETGLSAIARPVRTLPRSS